MIGLCRSQNRDKFTAEPTPSRSSKHRPEQGRSAWHKRVPITDEDENDDEFDNEVDDLSAKRKLANGQRKRSSRRRDYRKTRPRDEWSQRQIIMIVVASTSLAALIALVGAAALRHMRASYIQVAPPAFHPSPRFPPPSRPPPFAPPPGPPPPGPPPPPPKVTSHPA